MDVATGASVWRRRLSNGTWKCKSDTSIYRTSGNIPLPPNGILCKIINITNALEVGIANVDLLGVLL